MILTPRQKSTPDSAMFDADRIAQEILEAWRARRQVPSLAARLPGFDLGQAYQVTAALRRIRQGSGERPVGRKIGFTNRTIWDEYQVYAPIWGDMYATTLLETDGSTQLDLSSYLEPRIEPEIAFGLARAPQPGMDEAALLGCIAWVAHGFEIVHSMFEGWRFAAADTVAAFALHGAYRLGPRRPIERAPEEGWLAALTRFEISLYRNNEPVDRGQARNVLDGPLSALRHLNDLLAADQHNPPLAAGEIITTGTVTRAFPVSAGETWHTELHGLVLTPMEIRFS
jgi:2-oxo-3-hexenedioate decarboxylase